MYIDYGTEFSIEKFSHIPLQSQEDADSQSMPVDSQSQPEEQQAAAEEAQESCANNNKTSVENEDINEKAAEAYNIYLERHPEMSIEEQIVEAEEKLNDIAKNSKVNKAKQSKINLDEKLKRQAERKHDPALDDPKEAAKRAQIEKHKKEAREEYMRRHSMEFFGFGKKENQSEKPIKPTKSTYEPGTNDKNDVKEIFKIVKEVLQKHKNIKGFKIGSDSSEIEEFVNGDSSELFLVHCNAWEFYKPKSAREQMSIDGLEEFYNTINIIGKEISDKIVSKYGGKVEWDGGDWDETFISYYK